MIKDTLVSLSYDNRKTEVQEVLADHPPLYALYDLGKVDHSLLGDPAPYTLICSVMSNSL